MRTLWILLALAALLGVAAAVEAHGYGTSCQYNSYSSSASCHDPWEFQAWVSLYQSYTCGSTNYLSIYASWSGGGYAHYAGSGYYATSIVVEYQKDGGAWQALGYPYYTYSASYSVYVTPGTYTARVTVTTTEGNAVSYSSPITVRACTAADFAPRNVYSYPVHWSSCGYQTRIDSYWDSNAEYQYTPNSGFSYFEIITYQGGSATSTQYVYSYYHSSAMLTSPTTGSRSYQIAVTAVMSNGERSATAWGNVVTQRLCTPSDIDFKGTISGYSNQPCGGSFYNTIYTYAPYWVYDSYKTAWQNWRLERQVQGSGNWVTLPAYMTRTWGYYYDYAGGSNGPQLGVTYDYRVTYVGLEGTFPGNTWSARLEDCPTAQMKSVHMVPVCPPRNEVKWRLEPRPVDTTAPPSGMAIQRSANGGWTWTTLNEYSNGGIAHQGTRSIGYDKEWWNYDVYGGTSYSYRITYYFGSKGSTTSPAMTADAVIQKCNAPQLLNLQGQDAVNRGMGGSDGKIGFDLRWDYLDANTPDETRRTWLNDGANYYHVRRCETHPPGAQNQVETYRSNGHAALSCAWRLLRSDLQAGVFVNQNHVDDAKIWGNITYTYQGFIDTKTDDYYSNTGATWIRGEPWPIESMRVESFPYLHLDATNKSPPGDYPPDLAVNPRDARYGHAEVSFTAGNDGGGGGSQEYEVTFRYEGKTAESVTCKFTPAQYNAIKASNEKIPWRARDTLSGLVYPKDFTGTSCTGVAKSLKEGTVGHVILVRTRNNLGWSNSLQVDGLKAWKLDLGSESTLHSHPGDVGSASPTTARTKTQERTDRVTHDVSQVRNLPVPLNPPGYTGALYPGTTRAEAWLRDAEAGSSITIAGQPCQGPTVHQLYLNEQRGQELYGAKGKRLHGFDASYAKVKLWFYAQEIDFNTTNNNIASDAKAPLRYDEFLSNATWLNHSNARMAFVNQDTSRDEAAGYTPPDEDEQWVSKDKESYPNWEAFFQDDNGIPGPTPHFDFPDIAAFRLHFNGMGEHCFLDNLTADGEVTEKSRTCSFQFWGCNTKATDWQPGNPHFLGARIDVGETLATFRHPVYGKVFEERSEFVSDEGDQRPRVPHNPPAQDVCKCFRQTIYRTPEEHRLIQRFTSDYNLYEELQSRGNGRPAAGTEAMFLEDPDRPEDPPVDAQFMQQYDGILPQAIKDELARRNLEGAEKVRPPSATAAEPETPAASRYYSNGTEKPSGNVVHPYLGHVWGEVVPDRSVWWNDTFVVDGAFRPVLWIGATASPMVDWMEAHNITMAPPHVRWTYLLEANRSSPDYGFIGPLQPKPLVEGDGWNYTAPQLNLTRQWLANSTGRLTLFVEFGWKTLNDRNETIHTLNVTTSMMVLVHVPTLQNASLRDYGVPVLKYDENPRSQDVVRAWWHSYPESVDPWVTFDSVNRTYQGTPEAVFFRSGFTDHYEYRDPDPTPTGAWTTGEKAVNSTNPGTTAHPDDQRRLEMTDQFLHVAAMPRNRNQDDGVLKLSWNLFDTRRAGTPTSPGPEDSRFNVVRDSDGNRILSYGWLNNATIAGAAPGTVVPVQGTMALEYLIRVTPTLDWDGGAQKTRLDSNECRHGRWSLQVTYSDGTKATAGPVSQERCMTTAWRTESIPLAAGKGVQSISLVGLPYVSMSWQCDGFNCGMEPDATGRNAVYNVYLDGVRIRKEVGTNVSYLHLWDHYQPSLPLFEETGFQVDQFFVEAEKTPLTPRDAAERYEMVTPGDPFLVFLKVPDLPALGTTPFLHPNLVQGVLLGEVASHQEPRGTVEEELSRVARERELEVAESLDWSDPTAFPYEWYKDSSDAGLEHHLRGPWVPSATNLYLRYWAHLRGDADKDDSQTRVPDEDANPTSPGERTLNERFLPSFASSFATHMVHTTDEDPEGPDFYRYAWSPPTQADVDAIRDYYLHFQNTNDAAYVRSFEGTNTYLTTVAVDDLPREGLGASPLWPFHDVQPSNITLGTGFNLTVGTLIPANQTWSRNAVEEAAARSVLANVTPQRNVTHVEVHPLPVVLDGCWRFLTADNGTAIEAGAPGSNASRAGWQNVDLLHNVTSNITKTLQVRIYATVHRGTPQDEANVSKDICMAPNNHTVPLNASLRLAVLYRDAQQAPGTQSVAEGVDRMTTGNVSLLATYNSTGSYVELTFNATGVPTFYAIYDSWETYLKSDTMLIGQFDGPWAHTERFNWGSLLVTAILAAVTPWLLHRGYSATRKLWGGG